MTDNAVARAAVTAAKAKAGQSKAVRQINNENTAKFFAAGMCGMIFLFILFHWSRLIFKRYGTQRRKVSRFLDVPRRAARYSNLQCRKGKILSHNQ